MPDKVKRQLKAIAFADIVGYTAMMESNEREALLRLHRFREVLERETAAQDGRIVQYYGDGALLLFDSSIDALECAMHIQTSFRESPVVPVRIGIHSGDVVAEGDHVYGESVNLASRIESCGIPGAILFSERVKRDLKGHPAFQVAPLGRLTFKNVEEPQAVFAIANEGYPVPRKRDLQGKLRAAPSRTLAIWRWLGALLLIALTATGLWLLAPKEPPLSHPSRETRETDRSVAVLPFRWLSAPSEEEYFAEGVAEAIRGKLAQISGLRVTSMTSAQRYAETDESIQEIARQLRVAHILEGSIQKDSNRVQINVRLVDARNDRQVWSQSFDEQLTDIFSIQNRIAGKVAEAMAAGLNTIETQRLQNLATHNISAYEYFLAGRRDLFRSFQSQDTTLKKRARENFRKAIRLDPNYAQAYVGLAESLINRYGGPARQEQQDSALLLLDRAVDIDPDNDQAYAVRGEVYWMQRDVVEASGNFQKALSLSPSNTNALMGLSQIFMAQRKFDQAIPMIIRAISLDPRNQRNPFNKELYAQLAGLYLEARRDQEAEALLKRALELYPDDDYLYREYRMLLLTSGRFTEALAVAQKAYQQLGPSVDNTDQLALCYLFSGQYAEAERLYRGLYQMLQSASPENASSRTFRHRLAFALWQQGKREEARRLVAEHLAAEKAIIANGTLYRGQEYDIAAAYAFTGDHEAAYEWLGRMPYWSITYRLLRVDPLFDSMRGEPRFQRLLISQEEEVSKIRKALEKAEQQEGALPALKD